MGVEKSEGDQPCGCASNDTAECREGTLKHRAHAVSTSTPQRRAIELYDQDQDGGRSRAAHHSKHPFCSGFEVHGDAICAVAVFPDNRRMEMGSYDNTHRLWDLKQGVILKKMEGHRKEVRAVAVLRDGKLIAIGNSSGKTVWDGDTDECLAKAINIHAEVIFLLDLSPDGAVLASGQYDKVAEHGKLRVARQSIYCHDRVKCVRYSPATTSCHHQTLDNNIQTWNPCTKEHIVNKDVHGSLMLNISLAWTPGGRLLSWDDSNLNVL